MRCTEKDEEKINYILGHESVYPWICDDGCSENIRYELGTLALERREWIILSPNENTIFLFIPVNSVMYDVHTNILPNGRGKLAIKAAKQAMEWMFTGTSCLKLISWVPVFNKAAIKFSLMCGLKKEGNSAKSFFKDGNLYDQILFGITKEEFKCQQQ